MDWNGGMHGMGEVDNSGLPFIDYLLVKTTSL